MHNFLKHTITKFLHCSTLELDDILPIAAYVYNVAPSVNDLESPFFLVFGRDPLEGRLSHILQVPRNGARTAGSGQTQKYVEATCRITLRHQAGQGS